MNSIFKVGLMCTLLFAWIVNGWSTSLYAKITSELVFFIIYCLVDQCVIGNAKFSVGY